MARVQFAADDATFAAGLERLVADARVARHTYGSALALDTEFIRTRTYYPIAALYQLASPNEILIVDPLAIERWDAFLEALTDPTLVKIMHSCSEDLEVFARHLDVRPSPIFDTQVAAGFLGRNFSPGYAELVRTCVGVDLAKHQTRSDWLARPLSEDQFIYAVEDVSHLGAIYAHQCATLDRTGRRHWFDQENAERQALNGVSEDRYYLGVRAAWRCDESQLARLRALCAWREGRAKQRDLPRARVVPDDELVALAQLRSLDLKAVRAQLSPGAARRYGADLLALIESVDRAPAVAVAAPPRPLTRGQTKLLKNLKACATEVAEALDIAPELLARRRDLESCIRSYQASTQLPENYLNWRYPLVGERFEAILAAGEPG